MDKPNYRVITFTARLRGYNAADWPDDVPCVVLLFDMDGDYHGACYRKARRWFTGDDWPVQEIGYSIDLREVVEAARERITNAPPQTTVQVPSDWFK